MKRPFKFFSILFLLLWVVSVKAQESNTVAPEDLQSLVGEWTGTLTYLDYNTNNPFTMNADLKIEQGKDEYQLILSNIYPSEPRANNKDKMILSKDGASLNKKDVRSKTVLEDGSIEVITQYSGKDGNDGKKAMIRKIFLIKEHQFTIRKEVQFEGRSEWILRNEYKYARK